ncbi:DUF2690 domain-containing protein [Nonomuraea harbinensis]|uniref:DUF2690 domain-containing protein n=1 Tax=Nonomuraea harbinensis TaxID=1286938 RepID=A0ABW1C9W3_9ACTN|nr:DUF2690 domain-containing protein [Nonomuraea harbinensis]
MMKLLTLGRAALATALAVTALGGVAATSAQAAAGCSGASCVGKNPATMGCTADQTILERVRIDSYLEFQLVHSAACAARWGAFKVSTTGSAGKVTLTETRQVKTPYGWYKNGEEWVVADLSKKGTTRTEMNRNTGDDRHRVCASGFGCTSWRS